MYRSPNRLIWTACGWLAAILLSAIAWGDEFRIESRVFAGKEPKPVSENTTLFHVGIVYDFIPDKSIAIFDKPRGRFILLDRGRKVKAEVTVKQLQAFCDRLHEVAAADNNPFVRFVADPHFDAKTGDRAERADPGQPADDLPPDNDQGRKRRGGPAIPRILGLVRAV